MFQLTFLIYENIKKKRCWSCQSNQIIRWGKQGGKQRFRCKNCGLFFTYNSPSTSYHNRKKWFKDWIIGRRTFEQLTHDSGYSEQTLKRLFYKYLSQVPAFSVRPSEKVNLLIDGTYFSNNLCLVLYRDNTIKYTQLYRLTDGEWYEELKEDLENLIKFCIEGYQKNIVEVLSNGICITEINEFLKLYFTKNVIRKP
jgi:transposase-like protein